MEIGRYISCRPLCYGAQLTTRLGVDALNSARLRIGSPHIGNHDFERRFPSRLDLRNQLFAFLVRNALLALVPTVFPRVAAIL